MNLHTHEPRRSQKENLMLRSSCVPNVMVVHRSQTERKEEGESERTVSGAQPPPFFLPLCRRIVSRPSSYRVRLFVSFIRQMYLHITKHSNTFRVMNPSHKLFNYTTSWKVFLSFLFDDGKVVVSAIELHSRGKSKWVFGT